MWGIDWNMTWDIITKLSSICSIVALPIAIWQIISVKSKVLSTQAGIEEILSIREHEKLEEVLTNVKRQHAELIKMQSMVGQKGVSENRLSKTAMTIAAELNRSACDMPVAYDEIADSIRMVISNINMFPKTNKLNDAEAYLYTCIHQLKVALEKCYKMEEKRAARQ